MECACGLVYTAMKIYEAVEGQLGLPGFLSPLETRVNTTTSLSAR